MDKSNKYYGKGIIKEKYNLWDYIVMVVKNEPGWALAYITDIIIISLIPMLKIVLVANFLDSIIKLIEGKKFDAIFSTIMLVVVLCFEYVNQVLLNLIKTKLNNNISVKVDVVFVKHRAQLKYKYIENDKIWELINRTCENPAGRIIGGFYSILWGIQLGIQIVSIILVMFTKIQWMVIILIIFAVPLMFLAVRCGQYNYEVFSEAKKHDRRRDYYKSIIMGRDSANERVLFSYDNWIINRWIQKNDISMKCREKAEAYNYIKMKSASIITVLVAFFVSVNFIYALYINKVSVGFVVALIKEVFALVHTMSWDFADIIEELVTAKKYLDDMCKFSSLEKDNSELEQPCEIKKIDIKCVEFKNVSFSYPDSMKKILSNFSYKFEYGKKYALVGRNGSGKTTIIKLLLGLYSDYSGQILINGVDLKTISKCEIKSSISVIFQDFCKYNIVLKDYLIEGQAGVVPYDKMLGILDKMEVSTKINSEELLNYELGVLSENSSELSGGQWQKIALARGLLGAASLYILDEPTASIDPVAESDVYKLFANSMMDQTAIFITHRLGAARMADEILLIEEGKVRESGKHEQLVARGGIYAEMYETQKKWYE